MTRLPQLEQELVAAAARLQSPRRLLAPAARAALAVGAVAVAAVIALVIPAGEGGSPRPQPAAAPAFPPNANLQDMLGVFRLPATPADDLGFKEDDLDELPDRQPGEDPTRGRRVEWPGASISLWPMQDGVCYSVSSGGGCLPLDHLRRVGVSVGTQSGRQGSSVSGVVVDGIREVVLTASAGPDLHVPVSENFFFVDLTSAAAELEAPGWETRVQAVRWHYSGEERSFTVGRLLHDDGVTPVPSPPGITDGEPVHGRRLPDLAVHGLRGTDQGRRRHAALNRLPRRAATARRAGAAASPPLRRRGRRPRRLRAPGFARAKAVKLSPAYRTSDLTVILSKPWRPEPWKGEPIRFFFVFAPDENAQGVPPPHLPLDVRLSDGRTVRVP